jgi:hypothetical protein
LADFVVASANDHVVVVLVAVGEADVLVGFGSVIEEAVFDRSLGDLDSDAVGATELHLSYDTEFLQRYACRHDSIVAVDGMAGFGLDHNMLVVCDEWYGQAFLGDVQHARVGVAAEVRLFLEPFENTDTVGYKDLELAICMLKNVGSRLPLTDTWSGGMCLGWRKS